MNKIDNNWRYGVHSQLNRQRRQALKEDLKKTDNISFLDRVNRYSLSKDSSVSASASQSSTLTSEMENDGGGHGHSSFNKETAFEDTVLLSPRIVEKCHNAFRKFDTNNDNVIDSHELKDALLSMGFVPTDEELDEMMTEIDQNGDRKLDFMEFLRVIQTQKKEQHTLSEAEKNAISIKQAWQVLKQTATKKTAVGGTDTNADAGISTELVPNQMYLNIRHLKEVLSQFDLAIDVDRLVHNLDTDHNGELDFNEFRALFE